MNDLLPFHASAWVFISLYLSTLILIGWFGYKARKENTLSDFYLAGSSFGLIVLFLTLYATQYSGNTFFGYTGKTYRIGYAWIMSVHFMTAIVVCYLIYAPKLYSLSRQHGFVTPTDFLQFRFKHRGLNLLASIIMIIALSNFLLAQLMAMGRAMQGLTGADPIQAYNYGVILLTAIMVVYGTLGGIRAIAWTDAIQGLVLMLGFFILFYILNLKFGSIAQATEIIQLSTDAEIRAKASYPDADRLREWFSYIVLVGLAGSLYPQAMQRIYAARSARVLRQGLALMAFIPFITTLIAVMTGIYAIAYFQGFEGAASDQILTRMLADVQQFSVFGYWLVVILFAAALSAMMSTADSALLSISSMLSKDIYSVFINKQAEQATLTRVGKFCSWGLVIFLVWLAIYLQDKASLIQLLDRKFDLLIQLVPAFMLGIHYKQLKAVPVIIGIIAGVFVSLTLAFGGFEVVQGGKLYGFHPGLYGLVLNLLLAVSLSGFSPSRQTVNVYSSSGRLTD